MAKFLITGSVAMHHWYPIIKSKPKDIDIITESGIVLSSSVPSRLGIESHSNPVFSKILKINKDPVFVDRDILYTIKLSHAQWNIKWEKTINDILFFESNDDLDLNQELYDELVAYWTTVHGPKRVNLNMSNDQFFTDAVRRKIDHDILHQMVAIYDEPMHTLIRADKSSPKPDKALWDALLYKDKMFTAIEEICVVAIERGRLTKESKQSEILIAIMAAYKSLVTTMTKGWFCDFLLMHALCLLRYEKDRMVKIIRQVVNSDDFLMEMMK